MAAQLATWDVGDSAKACLLFTDIEGSTNLLHNHSDLYPAMLTTHFHLIETAIGAHGGKVIDKAGDSVFAVFPQTKDGLQAAIDAQLSLHEQGWPHGGELRVRMGIHCGPVQRFEDRLVGIEVHRAARISAVGRGGQIVLSRDAIRELGNAELDKETKIKDLGFFKLKDLHYPEALYEVEMPALRNTGKDYSSSQLISTNLPSEISALLGREKELSDLRTRVLDSQCRLLVLAGTGGAGKTSLAMNLGKILLSEFVGGVFFVQLSDIADPDLVAPVIAQTLGIVDQAGVSTSQIIARVIGDSRVLIILDTFEHVIEGAQIVEKLLEDCPNLHVIVTSRQPLSLPNETVVDVLPLSTPESNESLENIAHSPSVQLFVGLAKQENSRFDLNSDNAEAVAEICRLLDGLPLALALAAARVSLFDPSEIAERLQTRRLELKNRSQFVTSRHQTLEAAVEWSDKLLEIDLRETFHEISVFTGGFGIDAAVSVVGRAAIDTTLQTDLDSLVHKNLLFKRESLGSHRYFMLDTIREYSRDALVASETFSRAATRHAEFFKSRAVSASAHLLGTDQRNHVEGLFEESGNIRSALDWYLQQHAYSDAADLISALQWFWISRGLFGEGRRWTDVALERMGEADHDAALAEVECVAAWVRFMSGDPVGTVDPAVDSYRRFREAENSEGMSRAGIMAGMSKAVTGNEAEGIAYIEEALELAQTTGNDRGAAIALIAIGEGMRGEGDESGAEKYYKQALEFLHRDGDTFWPGMLAFVVSLIRLRAGRVDEAAKLAGEALFTGEQYNYPVMVILAVASAAGVASADGLDDLSARFIGAVQERMRHIGAGFEPPDLAAFNDIVSTTRGNIGEDRYAEEAQRGAAADWKDTVDAVRARFAARSPAES